MQVNAKRPTVKLNYYQPLPPAITVLFKFGIFLQGRPSGESFVQLKTPELAHKAANELHLKHMGERYIEVFQCSVHDMSIMLASSHANQMSVQQKNQLINSSNNNNNNNNTNLSNHSNNNFIPSSPLAMHHGHPLLSPSSSNAMVHPLLPPIPTVFNGRFAPMSPTISPNGFYPPHAFSLVSPMVRFTN